MDTLALKNEIFLQPHKQHSTKVNVINKEQTP
jgi:hypothetical protein